jgi:hypothetical protein
LEQERLRTVSFRLEESIAKLIKELPGYATQAEFYRAAIKEKLSKEKGTR